MKVKELIEILQKANLPEADVKVRYEEEFNYSEGTGGTESCIGDLVKDAIVPLCDGSKGVGIYNWLIFAADLCDCE